MSEERITRVTVDLENLPPLTAEQIELDKRLDAMPDEEIDLSEMPEVDFSLYRPARERKKAAPGK